MSVADRLISRIAANSWFLEQMHAVFDLDLLSGGFRDTASERVSVRQFCLNPHHRQLVVTDDHLFATLVPAHEANSDCCFLES